MYSLFLGLINVLAVMVGVGNWSAYTTIRFPTARAKLRYKKRPPKLDPPPNIAILIMYSFSTVTPFWSQIVGPVFGVVFCIVFWHGRLGNV